MTDNIIFGLTPIGLGLTLGCVAALTVIARTAIRLDEQLRTGDRDGIAGRAALGVIMGLLTASATFGAIQLIYLIWPA